MAEQARWVKLIFSETPTKANVKQGYLYDEGDFYRIIGDRSEALVRKSKVISITLKNGHSHKKPRQVVKNE